MSEKLDFLETDLQALVSVGLTVLQAKIYLTLIRSGCLPVKKISALSRVARQDIYRLTNELIDKGLVKRVLRIPNEFEAVSLVDGISILQKELDKERIDSRKKTDRLIERYKHWLNNNSATREEFNLSIIPQKEVLQFLINQIKKTKTSVDMVNSNNKSRFIIWTARDNIKKALDRNVKFRIIFNKRDDQKQFLPRLKFLAGNPLFTVRIVNYSPSIALLIYDNRNFSLMLKPKEKLSKTPLLTSNNTPLLEIVRDYFKIKWFTASEFEKGQSPKS